MKQSYLLTSIIFLFTAVLQAAPVPQPVLDLNKVIANVQKNYDKTTSFQANFKQKYTSRVLRKTSESQGSFSFQKPGNLRWDYSKPTKKTFIVSRDKMYLYQPEDKVAYFNKCFKEDSLTASIAFLWGQGKIKDQFEVSWVDKKPDMKKDFNIALTPKQRNSIFKKLVIVIDVKSYRVKESIVVDYEGNLNQFIFSSLKFNKAIAPSEFQFKAPAKTQVMPMPGSCQK